MIILFIPAVN